MNDTNEKKPEASPPPERKTANTITEFLSGMVEIGKERQGIRYSIQAERPAINLQAAH